MGGVKNNINKPNRNSGGPQEGLRWGIGSGGVEDPGSQRHLAFSHQGGELCKRKTTLLLLVTVSAGHQKDNTVTACDSVCWASAVVNTSCPVSSLAPSPTLLFIMVLNLWVRKWRF